MDWLCNSHSNETINPKSLVCGYALTKRSRTHVKDRLIIVSSMRGPVVLIVIWMCGANLFFELGMKCVVFVRWVWCVYILTFGCELGYNNMRQLDMRGTNVGYLGDGNVR